MVVDSEHGVMNAARHVEIVSAMRGARLAFADGIAAVAGEQRPGLLRRLKGESVFQIAEFFFLLKCHGITTTSQIKALARFHNDHLLKAMQSPDKLERLERTRMQLDAAMFSDVGIEKLAENFMRNPPSFDQSDLCRFLATQQSFENCRRSLKALREAGLLVATRTPYGSVLLHSRGALEQVYLDHVNALCARLPQLSED